MRTRAVCALHYVNSKCKQRFCTSSLPLDLRCHGCHPTEQAGHATLQVSFIQQQLATFSCEIPPFLPSQMCEHFHPGDVRIYVKYWDGCWQYLQSCVTSDSLRGFVFFPKTRTGRRNVQLHYVTICSPGGHR